MVVQSQLVADWLMVYSKMDVTDMAGDGLEKYAIEVSSHCQLIGAIFNIIEDMKYHEQFLEDICDQLCNYHRSKESRLQKFAVAFVPSMIGLHLTRSINASTESERHLYRSVDVLLLTLYNMEVINEDGNQIKRTFRFPVLSKPSVYHEPSLTSSQQVAPTAALTEHALHKHENSGGSGDLVIASFGPFVEHDQLVASTRWTILTVLMKVFNGHLSSLPNHSLYAVCRNCVKILNHGQPSTRTRSSSIISTTSDSGIETNLLLNYKDLISSRKGVFGANNGNGRRIQPSSSFLVELLNAVYFCLFNEVTNEGLQALNEIHGRALYSLFADVLLMTNAIKNTLKLTAVGQKKDDSPMGLSLALSPTSSTTGIVASGVSKTALTNASFRTRKLPDDIPIVATPVGTGTNATPTTTASTTLTSINEETEDAEGKGNDGTKNSKNIKSHSVSTSTGKVLQGLKGLNRKDKKKDKETSSKKDKKEKNDTGNGEATRIVNKNVVIEDVADGSSDLSETKSYCSDQETIPMTTFKPSIAGRVISGAFEVDDGTSNCSSSNLGSTDAVNVPNAGELVLGHKAMTTESSVNV